VKLNYLDNRLLLLLKSRICFCGKKHVCTQLHFFLQMERQMTHVLYVAHAVHDEDALCKGSTLCVNIAKSMHKRDMVAIQNVDILRKKQPLPSWLNGTPMLVDRTTNMIYKGTNAISEMKRLKMASSEEIEVEIQSQPQVIQTRGEVKRQPGEVKRQPGEVKRQPEKEEEMGYAHEEDDRPLDVFQMDTEAAMAAEEARSSKVTEEDLQKFMEARERSLPSGNVQGSAASMPPPSSGKE
jgi:hypothetical protein